jgi:hypothetical protein
MKLFLALLLSTQLVYAQQTSFTDTLNFIKQETSTGGRLDFSKGLEQKFYLFDGIAYSPKDMALFLWGTAVKKLGIKSPEKAIQLREEILEKEMTQPEKKALTNGFNFKPKE